MREAREQERAHARRNDVLQLLAGRCGRIPAAVVQQVHQTLDHSLHAGLASACSCKLH